MDSERMDEVGQDIGETAEALDRLLGRSPEPEWTSGEAERAPGGVPTSPELPSGNGEGEARPPAAPQPEEEPELVPVGAKSPDPVKPAKKRTRKAKKGTTPNPKDGTVGELEEGPTAQNVQNVQSGQAGCVECGGECQGHPERAGGGEAGTEALAPAMWGATEPPELEAGGEGGVIGGGSPEAVGQDHPGELVALEPPVWGELSRANDEAGEAEPPAEEEPGKGLVTIYDYTDEDLIKMGTDKLLELAGITTVDLTDAKDYEQIRGSKLVAVEKLQHALANTNTQDMELLAKISQKLGQLEKAKMEVIQLKLGGKPGDRTKPGTTLRARIGIASTGADGRSVVELEVEGK